MNEAETRAELIDPKLKACGWGVVEGSKILRERQAQITDGKINVGGVRSKPMKADYILVYKGIKLAVVEAKSNELSVGEGVAQAKLYAEKLKLETTYSTNGKEIYSICMKTGAEGLGILRSAPGIGAILVMLIINFIPLLGKSVWGFSFIISFSNPIHFSLFVDKLPNSIYLYSYFNFIKFADINPINKFKKNHAPIIINE